MYQRPSKFSRGNPELLHPTFSRWALIPSYTRKGRSSRTYSPTLSAIAFAVVPTAIAFAVVPSVAPVATQVSAAVTVIVPLATASRSSSLSSASGSTGSGNTTVSTESFFSASVSSSTNARSIGLSPRMRGHRATVCQELGATGPSLRVSLQSATVCRRVQLQA